MDLFGHRQSRVLADFQHPAFLGGSKDMVLRPIDLNSYAGDLKTFPVQVAQADALNYLVLDDSSLEYATAIDRSKRGEEFTDHVVQDEQACPLFHPGLHPQFGRNGLTVDECRRCSGISDLLGGSRRLLSP